MKSVFVKLEPYPLPMEPIKWIWPALALVFCFFAGGWISWRGSYAEYLAGDNFPRELLVVFASVAFVLSWIIDAGLIGVFVSTFAVGFALPATVCVRVILDCMQDPTSHNLWPFEAVAAAIYGTITAFPAACFGGFLRRIIHRNEQTDSDVE